MDAKPVDDAPHSTEKYDDGALLPEQQKKINEMKVWFDSLAFSVQEEHVFKSIAHFHGLEQIRKRIENERYLQKHPELNVLLRDFIRQACLQKPDNIREFAAGEHLHYSPTSAQFSFSLLKVISHIHS